MTVKETNEWDNYRAIDLLKRIKREEIHERYIDRHKAFDMAIQALEEVEQYRALGTVEELKEANKIKVGDKVTVKDYFGIHKVVSIQSLNSRFCFWLDNGDLVNHKRIEKVIKEEGGIE